MKLLTHRKKTDLSVGIGVDIERIRRFRPHSPLFRSTVLNKIFTARERAYCRTKYDPAPHFAARYTAKEAVMKALSEFGARTFTTEDYRRIEVLRTNGAPYVRLTGFPGFKAQITLSHDRVSAVAFAVVRRLRH